LPAGEKTEGQKKEDSREQEWYRLIEKK
jgi:hypothetical protein